MGNHTKVIVFILEGLTDDPQFKVVLFIFLLLTYLLSITGNSIIIILTLVDPHLKTPMYFFLWNFSFLEISFTTTCIPNFLVMMATGDKTISYSRCAAQVFFIFLLGASEFYLLAAMSYDRYVAICKPLHYTIIMSSKICIQLVLSCWIAGFFTIFVPLLLGLQLDFCDSNIIQHFFCDIMPVVKLACVDTSQNEIVLFAISILFIMSPCLLILSSYVRILVTILRIPSAAGRHKAFSTCSSHILVVSLFYGTALFTYLQPKAAHTPASDKATALMYTVVTPALNPVIYTLRNKEVKEIKVSRDSCTC
uniref:Olfactory receptor n=1 Tax=Catagonus wagneri TaxID=51154 RepID=A0A8C3WET3_9CETA